MTSRGDGHELADAPASGNTERPAVAAPALSAGAILLLRIASWIGAAGMLAMASIEIATFASIAVPIERIGSIGFPILVISALTLIPSSQNGTDDHGPPAPLWMKAMGAAMVLNTFAILFLQHTVTWGGGVEERDGKSFLVNHGRVISELDPDGVHTIRLWEARQFSSHLLLMLTVATFWLILTVRAESRRRQATLPE